MGNKKSKDSKEATETTSEDAAANAMKLKLLVMGSKGVGKTQGIIHTCFQSNSFSVILRFADNTFTDNFRYKIPNGMVRLLLLGVVINFLFLTF
jgi:F0F1-type ATP synthase assembly protein I